MRVKIIFDGVMHSPVNDNMNDQFGWIIITSNENVMYNCIQAYILSVFIITVFVPLVFISTIIFLKHDLIEAASSVGV